MKPRLMRESIRWRLAFSAACTMFVALFLTGWTLRGLFHDHVTQQFAQALESRLDQVTAALEMSADGVPRVEPGALGGSLWQEPYSGLYWQIDRMISENANDSASRSAAQTGVLRSRSLWDATLTLPLEALTDDGRARRHEIRGPNRQPLMALERAVRADESAGSPWRLIVAADMSSVDEADARFSGLLALSLGILFALLLLGAVLQIHVGLTPLRHLRFALGRIRQGKAQQLSGHYPQEVQPLVEDFNQVLARNAEIVSRSRSQAGNLAHAIKTPLAVLQQAGEVAVQTPETRELAQILLEQVEVAGRQVNWHLARSRAAAAVGVPGHATPLAPALASLARVMKMIYAERGIEITWDAPPETAFAGEAQDLQEMLGNLLDNACKWAKSRVVIGAVCHGAKLEIDIADDGPGISLEAMPSARQRGVRLDESTPGSGLGLSIVTELATLYRGRLEFSRSPELSGLRARLILPSVSLEP